VLVIFLIMIITEGVSSTVELRIVFDMIGKLSSDSISSLDVAKMVGT
jgi:hypothetical protein